jgi:hypothetical protein
MAKIFQYKKADKPKEARGIEMGFKASDFSSIDRRILNL